MKVINFDKSPSLMSQLMMEMRNVAIQKDRLRFRRNLERAGEIMAYEMSRTMRYRDEEIQTPLDKAVVRVLDEPIVLATIFRAGLPFHAGFLNYFDNAENAFVSAYRRYHEVGEEFDIKIEYLASPDLTGKTVILCDPMLATGLSMYLSYQALTTNGKPGCLHLASVIASQQAVDYLQKVFPGDETTLWVGAIDDNLNAHHYIVPGLGDAGDLAFGEKL